MLDNTNPLSGLSNPRQTNFLTSDTNAQPIPTQQIADDIRLKSSPKYSDFLTSFQQENQPNSLDAFKDNRLKLKEFSVNIEDTYTRLNDNTYQSKFENYIEGTNNEERLAQGQSTSDKWINGLEKLVLKTGNVVLGNTVGFVNGFIEAAKQGSLSAVYDNDFTKTLDDWNTKLDYKLPNYYTEQEKNAGFVNSLGSANFWANDVLAGTAFTLGTVASEAIWAYATGGASLALRGARIGSKVGTAARVGEEAIVAERTLSGIEKMKQFIKQPLKSVSSKGLINREGAIRGSKAGEILNTVRFGLTSASGEASIEAWHYKKEAKENFYNNFEQLNGRKPTDEEINKFEEDLANSANAVFATNYFLVGGANLAFFGSQFGVKNPLKSLSKDINKSLFGIGTEVVETGGKKVVQALKANRFQNIAGKTYGVGSNLFNEVILEEGLQGVTTKTANNWLESTYDPKKTAENLDMMGMVYEAMANTYGTKEGWKELGTAALTTIIGGTATGNLFGDAKAIDNKRKGMEYNASGLNTFAGDIFIKRLAMTNQIQGANERKAEADAKGDLVGGEIARNDSMFSRLNFNYNIQRDSKEDISDLQDSLNLMTEEQFKEAGIDVENIEQFKTNTVEEYKTLSESFEKNRQFAEAIIGKGEAVGAKVDNINEGIAINGKQVDSRNKSVLIEALTYNLTMGEVTGGLQTDLLTSIKKEILGNFTQSNELVDALDIDRVLLNSSEKTKKTYKNVSRRIKTSNTKREALKKELLSLERNKNSKEDNTTYNQRYTKVSSKLLELEEEYAQLKQERDVLFKAAKVENPFIKDDASVSSIDLDSTEKRLSDLNDLVENLKETNLPAHLKISKLISEYNRSVEQFKEFDNTAKKLSDPKYKPKDQSSFLSKIINGKKSMDEFTKDFFIDTIKNYNDVKNAYLKEQADEINADISNEDYKNFQDNKELSEELLTKISQKVKNNETLLPREKEIYESKKEEVDAIKDTIEVTPPKSDELVLSSTEQLVKRIETAIEANSISMTYVGESYDDIINAQPTQEELEEYEEYLEKINNSKRKDKDFATRVNPSFSTNTKAEIGLTKEEIVKFQALNLKLSQWRMLDGAVSGESESIADLIEILNQMKISIEQEQTKNKISSQDFVTINETEESQGANDVTQNSFTQVHDNTTAKIVTINKENAVRFSDLNIITVVDRLQQTPVIITLDGQSRLATAELINEFGKVKGTKFVLGEATFTIEDRGRISIKESEYTSIKETLNLIPLSSNLTYSTYSPVYQKAGEEVVQVSSDFIPSAPIDYNPEANYEVSEGEEVEFEVRFDDPFNASLIAELKATGKKISKELADKVEKNLVIFTTLKGNKISGSLKATHSTISEGVTNTKFLEVRKNAYLVLLENLNSDSKGFKLGSKVKIRNVVLGFPNMNAQQTEEGYEPLNVAFTDESLGVVVNTGYVLNGKSFLSKDDKGVRFDFTTKISKKNKNTKIPVVVFEYKGFKIAYPISLVTTTIQKSSEIEQIFNDPQLSESEKVKKINAKLVENNIEPKQFELINLDPAKLKKIAEAMDSIEDFINVETLADKDYDKNFLKTQTQIAINLLDKPVTAPKLVLDFSEYSGEEITIQLEKTVAVEEQETVNQEVEKYNKEIAKLLKKQETIDKKIEKIEKIYQSQVKVLQTKRAKASEYHRIEKTRDLALAKLDAEMEILDDEIVEFQNKIEELTEEEDNFTVPAEDLEEIDDITKCD
jgi:hypothetical protein